MPKTVLAGKNRLSSSQSEVVASSSLHIYMQEINATPLLSKAEERELARRLDEGDEEARQCMVKANLRLVVNIARRYINNGLSLDDLIEEGNIGLLRAAQDFSSTFKTRFSTYASHWIKQSIKRAIVNTGRSIRLPAYLVVLVAKWRRANNELTDALGHAPSNAQVAFYLKLPRRQLIFVEQALKVAGAYCYGSSGDEDSLLDTIATEARSADEEVELADELAAISRGLAKLHRRHREVINMRFGLNGPAMSLDEVGAVFEVGKERARQIESEALDKLQGMRTIKDNDDHSLLDPADNPAVPVKTKAKKAKKQSRSESDQELADRAIILCLMGKRSTAGQKSQRRKADKGLEAKQKSAYKRKRVDPATCDVEQTESEKEFASAGQLATQHKGGELDASEQLALMACVGYEPPDELKQPSVSAANAFSFVLKYYKETADRRFPTWSEKFQLLHQLGFHKVSSADP